LPQLNQPVGVGENIVIREYRQIAFSQCESGIQRVTFTWLGLTRPMQGEAICKRGKDLSRLVRTTVIDEDQFPAGGRCLQMAVSPQDIPQNMGAISRG
jgi:hypothetical protein